MTPEAPAAPKNKLDTVANIAIIVVCALAAVVLIRNLVTGGSLFGSPQGGGPQPAQVEKGETYPELQKMVPAGSSRALVVALSPTCHYCNESFPFYKKLIDERNQKGSGVKVIAVVPAEEAKPEEAKKFAENGVQPDDLVHANFAAIKVPGTPTILLVDNKGEVLDVWVGKLDEEREKDVLEVL